MTQGCLRALLQQWLLDLATSSVQLFVRPWVKTEHYWQVHFDLTEKVKMAFDEVGIEIPFNQLDIRLSNQST